MNNNRRQITFVAVQRCCVTTKVSCVALLLNPDLDWGHFSREVVFGHFQFRCHGAEVRRLQADIYYWCRGVTPAVSFRDCTGRTRKCGVRIIALTRLEYSWRHRRHTCLGNWIMDSVFAVRLEKTNRRCWCLRDHTGENWLVSWESHKRNKGIDGVWKLRKWWCVRNYTCETGGSLTVSQKSPKEDVNLHSDLETFLT